MWSAVGVVDRAVFSISHKTIPYLDSMKDR